MFFSLGRSKLLNKAKNPEQSRALLVRFLCLQVFLGSSFFFTGTVCITGWGSGVNQWTLLAICVATEKVWWQVLTYLRLFYVGGAEMHRETELIGYSHAWATQEG